VTSAKILKLCTYIENTWFKDRLWTPERWSVYGQPVRTNNDAEGWHHRINGKVSVSRRVVEPKEIEENPKKSRFNCTETFI